jgi:hypothetical protein
LGDQNEDYAGAVDVANQISQESRPTKRDVREGYTTPGKEFARVEEIITTVFECLVSASEQFIIVKMTDLSRYYIGVGARPFVSQF